MSAWDDVKCSMDASSIEEFIISLTGTKVAPSFPDDKDKQNFTALSSGASYFCSDVISTFFLAKIPFDQECSAKSVDDMHEMICHG